MAITTSIQLQPSAEKSTYLSNYLDNLAMASQYLPDLYEKEVLRYGKQSIASYIRAIGAEIPFSSDLIQWSEEGRLHAKYVNCTSAGAAGDDTATITISDTLNPGNGTIAFNENDVIYVYANNGTGGNKAIVTAVSPSAGTITVAYYEASGQVFAAAAVCSIYVTHSEFEQGSAGAADGLESQIELREAIPIITRTIDKNPASKLGQIGWVQAELSDGGIGYLWYLKSTHDARLRHEDRVEMQQIEAIPAETGSGAKTAGKRGAEGIFYSIENYGNVWGAGYPDTISEFDSCIDVFDKNGSIPQYAIHCKRVMEAGIDDMMADLNQSASGGLSYGLFDNSEQMALNFSFKGFSRSGYEFYKTSFRYLNDPTLRGDVTGTGQLVYGVFSPGGSMSIKDKITGESTTRAMLHSRYRVSDKEDRRLSTKLLGRVAGTDDTDELKVSMLSEIAVCVLGANNFLTAKA
jgi:hypothetical protein